MPTATVPSPNAGVPGRGRADRGGLVLGHVIPALLASLFVAVQLALLGDSLPALLRGGASLPAWLTVLTKIEALTFFILLTVVFVVRLPARGGDRRPLVVVVANVGSYVILAGALLTARLGASARGLPWILAADVLVAVGMALAVWSLAHLRRSFSILPEARRLVVDGPYAFSRNPLYLAELVAGVGVLLPAFGVAQAIFLSVFVLCQVLRIGWEERVLAERFGPEFDDYRARVPRFLSLRPASMTVRPLANTGRRPT